MKVVCMNNKGALHITVGKVYDVDGFTCKESVGEIPVVKVDDNGSTDIWYSSNRFRSLEDVRSEKLNELLR